jgi:diguanylate cyclase (GGDEF)-like protein
VRRIWSRVRPSVVATQLLTVVGAAVVLAGITIVTLSLMRGHVDHTAREGRAALVAAQIDHSTEVVQQVVQPVVREQSREMSAAEAIVLHSELHLQSDLLEELLELGPAAEVEALQRLNTEQLSILDELAAGLTASGPRFGAAQEEFDQRIEDLAPRLATEARADEQSIGALILVAQLITAGALLSVAAALGSTSVFLGRRQRRMFHAVELERADLIRTTRTMERRNQQFEALYHVVNEVSDTLSLTYVVDTAIREAKALVRADITALRLLKGDVLELAGVEADVEGDAVGLRPMRLGTGLVGRAGKRGATVLIGEDVEARMEDGERILGVQSGIIIPLIVGARVVGTLACWSRIPNHFSPDDQRVLEMMAAQVATAVAAAAVHEASERDAHTDALTELPNRRGLTRDISEVFAPAVDAGTPLTVVMLDVDHFKRFNDQFGHKTGDLALKAVAAALKGALRAGDRAYRYGGEEFTVVLSGLNAHQALLPLERIRAAVEQVALVGESGQSVGPITISGGVAWGPGQSTSVESLLKFADAALYESKAAGRNRVTVYAGDEDQGGLDAAEEPFEQAA